jgi:hypothetical protein
MDLSSSNCTVLQILEFSDWQDRQCAYNVTSGRFRVTCCDRIAISIMYSACVCVWILCYAARKAHAPFCRLWPVLLCRISSLRHFVRTDCYINRKKDKKLPKSRHTFLQLFLKCRTKRWLALLTVRNMTNIRTRWFKYDRDKLWLVYTQSVPVIFELPCNTTNSISVRISLYLWGSLCMWSMELLNKLRYITLRTGSTHSSLTGDQSKVPCPRVYVPNSHIH